MISRRRFVAEGDEILAIYKETPKIKSKNHMSINV